MGRPPIGKTALSAAERHKRYMARLRARAETGGKPDTHAKPVLAPAIKLNWEIGMDDDGEGYVLAYMEPNGLYIRQIDGKLFFWHVNKDGDDGKHATDVAEGEAPSLIAAMAAAEAAAAKAREKRSQVRRKATKA
jgi:hypothetical protein